MRAAVSFTERELKDLLPQIPREEKEALLRLTQPERELILEIYRQFPGVHRVEDLPPVAKPTQLGPNDPFPEGF